MRRQNLAGLRAVTVTDQHLLLSDVPSTCWSHVKYSLSETSCTWFRNLCAKRVVPCVNERMWHWNGGFVHETQSERNHIKTKRNYTQHWHFFSHDLNHKQSPSLFNDKLPLVFFISSWHCVHRHSLISGVSWKIWGCQTGKKNQKTGSGSGITQITF